MKLGVKDCIQAFHVGGRKAVSGAISEAVQSLHQKLAGNGVGAMYKFGTLIQAVVSS